MDSDDRAPETDLNAYVKTLWNWRREIAYFVGSICVLTIIFSLVATPTYRSAAKLLPIGQDGTDFGSLLGPSGGIAVLGQLGGAFSTSEDRFMAVLASRRLGFRTIDELNLTEIYFPEIKEKGLSDLEQREIRERMLNTLIDGIVTTDYNSKLNTIEIAAVTDSRERSKAIVDAYIQGLDDFLANSTLSVASKSRKFAEKQKANAISELARIEQDFTAFQEKYNILEAETQTEVALKYVAELEAELMSKELQLGFHQKNSPKSSPAIVRLKQEMALIEQQLDELSDPLTKEQEAALDVSKTIKPLHVMTDLSQKFFSLRREYLTHETLVGLLTKQLEVAKMKEQQSQDSFEVLDRPELPAKRHTPKRKLMVILAFLASSVLAGFATLIFDAFGLKPFLLKKKTDVTRLKTAHG